MVQKLTVFIVSVFTLAACSASSTPAPTAIPTEEPTATTAPTLTVAPTTEEQASEPTAAATATNSGPEARPHRDAPAPLDEFVSDDPQYVGNTGKPQLVEFFTFW